MRKQLIAIALAAMTLPMLAFVPPILILISWNVESRAVAEATQRATALAAVAGALTEASVPDTPVGGVATSVFLPDGRVLGVPTAQAEVEAARGCAPSTTRAGDAVTVLVPFGGPRGCAGAVRVLVGEQALHRNRSAFLLLVLGVSVALVAAGVLVTERMGRGLVRSAGDLARATERIADGDLAGRAAAGGPKELRTAAVQLNRLAVRLDHVLHQQRQRAADIAHRLRTPLTALRLDIDTVTDRGAGSRLLVSHEAVVTALDEVIRASRRGWATTEDAVTDLAGTVATRATFWSVLARGSDRRVHVDVPPEPLAVRVGQKALEAALDALLGNVFAHTPAGVGVWLSARTVHDGDAVLVVEDSGPGFGHLDVVGRGRSDGDSTGLGLDIARRTAEDALGEIRLGTSAHGGARVELRFPPVGAGRTSG